MKRVAPAFGRESLHAMAPEPWYKRKVKLMNELHIIDRVVAGYVNVAIRITVLDAMWGECEILDLDLKPTIEEASRSRKPRATGTFMAFRRPQDVQLRVGQDYMLVGAEIALPLGPVLPCMRWPAVTADSGSISLSTAAQCIGEIVELFAGGMNAWSQAAKYLPLVVTMRVDCKPLAAQVMHINDRLCGQEDATICQSDVADLRVLARLKAEEGLVASPPCQPFSGIGKGQGLDAPSATAWDRLFKTLRLSQRRYAILENVCGIAKHADFQEVLQTMLYCGYALIAKRTCDATGIGCAARPRVMMIFWNVADLREMQAPRPHVPSIASRGPPVACMQSGSIWYGIPQKVVEGLRVAADELTILSRSDVPPRR